MPNRDFTGSQETPIDRPLSHLERESVQARWLKIDRERQLLLEAWAEHENALAHSIGWLRMTDEDKASHRENAKFVEIENRLDHLDEEGARLLAALPTDILTDLSAIVENLQVAAGLVVEDEDPIGHGLIVRAVRDLTALRCVTDPEPVEGDRV